MRLKFLAVGLVGACLGSLALMMPGQAGLVAAQGGSNGLITDTTATDFGACGELTSVVVTAYDDGEVRLIPLLSDHFEGAKLDATRWLSGSLNSGYGVYPSVANSLVNLENNWIRSQTSFSQARIGLSASVQLADPTTGWADLGFGKPNQVADPPNILFITDASARLFANAYHPGDFPNGPNRDEISGINLADYHTFRMVIDQWQTIDYYVDGVHRHNDTFASPIFNQPAYIWLQTLNIGRKIKADWIRVDYYEKPAGTYVSCVHDAGHMVNWNMVAWVADQPPSTSLSFRTRTSVDGVVWSPWSEPLAQSGALIPSPDGRYLQYKAELGTADVIESPELQAVTLSTLAVRSFEIILPATGQAGQPFAATVRLMEADHKTVDGSFNGTVSLSSSNGGTVSPGQITLGAGTWAGEITLTTPGQDRAVQAVYGPTTGVGYINLQPYQIYLPLTLR